MLSDVFDVLENFAALCATILVRRHGTSPLMSGLCKCFARAPAPGVSSYDDGVSVETLFRDVVEVSQWPTAAYAVGALSSGSSISACTLRFSSSGSISKPVTRGPLQLHTDKQSVLR